MLFKYQIYEVIIKFINFTRRKKCFIIELQNL